LETKHTGSGVVNTLIYRRLPRVCLWVQHGGGTLPRPKLVSAGLPVCMNLCILKAAR
jgi:hypothetical protein